VFDTGVNMRDPASFGEYRLTYRTGDILSPHVDVVEPLALEMLDFCAAVRGESQPRASARVGLDVVRIVEAVEHSLASGGGPIALEPTAPPRAKQRRARAIR
jgi:predicted dehydrogenase